MRLLTREELAARGYTVENMQAVWGDGWWNGLWRWVHSSGEPGNPMYTEESAWLDCAQYAAQEGAPA